MKRIVVAFGIGPALLLLMAACRQDPPPPPKIVAQAAVANHYVGSSVCGECHAAEFQAHRNTHHARALRLMNRESLGDQAPPTGRIGKTAFQLVSVGEGFGFGPANGPVAPLQLAFGSGKSGMAFTLVLGNDTLAEARMSYFPPRKEWYVTPGQEDLPKYMPGNMMHGTSARQCVSCHVVTLPEDTLMPEKKFLGVGCEACHGQGEAHVTAMRASNMAHIGMEDFSAFGGKKINQLCGRCHRTEQDVQAKNLPAGHTDLFQGYGLEQSRCFRESGDRLTCVTCHDPHANADTKVPSYTAACLRCHADPKAASTSSRLMQAKVCPVNPTANCVTCHMPKRAEPVFPGSPRRVADHFIRVHGQGAAAAPAVTN